MEDNFDTILTKIGTGKWNILFLIAMGYWYSLLPYHTVAGAFMGPPVDHTCRAEPTPRPITTTTHLLSTHTPTNVTYAHESPNSTDPSCNIMVRDPLTGSFEEQPCTEWDFDNSTFSSTVTSEFQLVCGRKYLRATYQSMYMFGMLIGALFNGFLSDRYGRWTMIAISTVSYTIIALGSAWLPTITTLLMARFMLGTMHPTSLQTGYILVLEVTELRMRARIGLSQFITWSTGTMLFSAWAYLIRDWRYLQTAVSLPCLLFLPLLFLLGESPRWMAVVGQHQRALKELKRAARWNKVTLPPDEEILAIMEKVQQKAVLKKTKANEDSDKSWFAGAYDRATILFRTPKLRLIMIIILIDYFVGAMLFFGLTLGAGSLGVDPFMYVAIAAAAEFPSTTIMIPVVSYFGRKKMMASAFFLCSVSLLTQPLITEDLKWLSILLVMIGKMASSMAFNILFLYSLELIPTELRTQGMGAGMASSRAGAIVAPFLMSALESTYPWAIPVVFGAAAAVAGVAVIPLWETQNTRLPDTIADLEGYNITKDEERPTPDETKNGRVSNGVTNPIPVGDESTSF